MKIYQPAPWISSRTYSSPTWRSAISNAKIHEFLVLADESARLWREIETGATYQTLHDLATQLGVEGELESFLDELREAELIADGASSTTACPPPPNRNLEHADNTDVEHEMMQWASDHGYLWSIFWELTYRCNEKCAHCYNPGAAHSPSETSNRHTDELNTS